MPQSLKRALANLIDNAVKFGHAAHLSVVDDAESLHIVVADEGPGIPAGDLERVVEPYIRLETPWSRATGGIGLGLAVARDAALLHGGELVLENNPEVG
jgi:signal transduction histidine kinase